MEVLGLRECLRREPRADDPPSTLDQAAVRLVREASWAKPVISAG